MLKLTLNWERRIEQFPKVMMGQGVKWHCTKLLALVNVPIHKDFGRFYYRGIATNPRHVHGNCRCGGRDCTSRLEEFLVGFFFD